MRRQVHVRQKKLRGIPRRLRSLRKWAEGFKGHFPKKDELDQNPQYSNWKIPSHWGLVEGKYTNLEIQRQCAQLLIDACGSLIAARPDWAAAYRVTCCICLPDLHTSELCIYIDEDYFRSKTEAASNEYGFQAPIENRTLATDWSLSLPNGVEELGVLWRYDTSPDVEDHYVSEHWMYGDVR